MNNVVIHDPFLLSFFQISVENWPEKKEKLLNLIDWNDPNCDFGCYFSDYFKNLSSPNRKCKYHKSFVKILSKELNEIVQTVEKSEMVRPNSFGKKPSLRMVTELIWAQRYSKMQSMEPHTHEEIGYSAILFAEFDKEEHQATEFFGPFKNVIDTMDYRWVPDVKEGDIIFFPGRLMHFSKPNPSEKRRTIFSFNCKFLPIGAANE